MRVLVVYIPSCLRLYVFYHSILNGLTLLRVTGTPFFLAFMLKDHRSNELHVVILSYHWIRVGDAQYLYKKMD